MADDINIVLGTAAIEWAIASETKSVKDSRSSAEAIGLLCLSRNAYFIRFIKLFCLMLWVVYLVDYNLIST